MCDPSSEATFLPRGAISASLGFPLHSAEISMSSRFVGRPQAFPDRASRGALFLTSLLILALLSLLAYVVKNFLVIQKLDPAPCSANCTIYASPSGNDKNSGSDPSSPKTFLGAAAATRPGSLVCLLPGTYDLDSSFTPPQSGAASAWIVYKSCGDGAVNFVWAGSPDASPMFKLGSGPFPSGPSYSEFRGLHFDGFHNVVSNNFVTGEVDQSPKHTDGNGIILELSNRTYDYSSADTPPALVINIVVYGNGGRCLEAYTVTNFWFVNNTCYKNVLDLPEKSDASITVNNSHDGYIVNNLVVAAAASHPCYSEENKAEEIRYFANLCFGGSNLWRHANSSQFISGDPP